MNLEQPWLGIAQLFVGIVQVLVGIVGAIWVVSYWNRKKHELEEYRYLDISYNEILKTYFENSRFGQPELVKKYAAEFKDAEKWKYHYFAMRIHTFLESIFDLSNGEIPPEWKAIYQHHARLHATWLRDHQGLQEPGYCDDVLGPNRHSTNSG